jgi:hypothetical protein
MEQTLRPYNPTWRDQLAQWVLGDQRPTAGQRSFVSGLLGSAGTGSTGASVADMTPIGGLLSAQESAQRGDMKGAALAMLPMPAAKARGIIAYHGSPHSFDRFNLSKIGTGEGAQAYGHGLYFADNEGVAKSYRDTLAGANNRFLDSSLRSQKGNSVVIENPIGDGWRAAIYQGEPGFKNQTGLPTSGLDQEFFSTFDEALAHAQKQGYIDHADPALSHYSDGYHQPIDRAGIASLEDLTGAQIVARNPGSMYQVRINADPEHFLDWDKPLSEQSPIVQRVAQEFGVTTPSAEDLARDQIASGRPVSAATAWAENAAHPPTGMDLVRKVGQDEFGSLGLKSRGIPGIKYLDQGSRGAGEGSRNYVVFDDSLVEILKKYGLVGLLGGGAALGASGQPQPEL